MLQARKAFTLLELIVVIVVAGILAGIAIPSFNAVKTKSNEQRAIQEANAFAKEINSLLAFTEGTDGQQAVDDIVGDALQDVATGITYNATTDLFTSTNNVVVTVTVDGDRATVVGLGTPN